MVNEVINEKDTGKKKELERKSHDLAEPMDGEYIGYFCALAAESKIYFVLGFFCVGEMICADRRFPEVARTLALKGADLIICPACGNWGEKNSAYAHACF